MKNKLPLLLATMATVLLCACSKSPKIFGIDNAPTHSPASISLIQEGSMLLRRIDGKRYQPSELPNPFSDFLFGLKPGKHTFGMMNIQRGHPLLLSDLRCYTMEVDLKPGVTYRIDEDLEKVQGTLRVVDTQTLLATAKLVQAKSAYSDTCYWDQTK